MKQGPFSGRPGTLRISLYLALLAGPLASAGAFAQQYAITDLGPGVSPTDINNDGTVVGYYQRAGETLTTAFRFPAASGLPELEDLAGPGSRAAAVNDAGQVVGNTPDGAFLLDGGNVTEWPGYEAYGINESGWVSGSAVMENPWRETPDPRAPAVYTGTAWEVMDIAKVYSRGTREGVYADIYALRDINTSGAAVGERRRYGLTGSSAIAVNAPYGDVVTAADADYLSPGGEATAVNDTGTIVGTGSDGRAFLCNAPCLDPADVTDLGSLLNDAGEYGLHSRALDVNESRQVVGTSSLATVSTGDPAQYRAVLWDDAGNIQDLNSPDVTEPQAGWLLTEATAINDDGEIVGTGLLDGEPHGFLLSSSPLAGPSLPAEPSLPGDEPPVADARADSVRGKAPLTVGFSAAGSYDPEGTALAYRWDFGDGASSDLANPAHTYTAPGDYVATLVVIDRDGTGQRSEPAQAGIRVQKGGRK